MLLVDFFTPEALLIVRRHGCPSLATAVHGNARCSPSATVLNSLHLELSLVLHSSAYVKAVTIALDFLQTGSLSTSHNILQPELIISTSAATHTKALLPFPDYACLDAVPFSKSLCRLESDSPFLDFGRLGSPSSTKRLSCVGVALLLVGIF